MAGSVGGSSLSGGSASAHGSAQLGGAYGGQVQITSVPIRTMIVGRNLQWCTAHSSHMIGSDGMGIWIWIQVPPKFPQNLARKGELELMCCCCSEFSWHNCCHIAHCIEQETFSSISNKMMLSSGWRRRQFSWNWGIQVVTHVWQWVVTHILLHSGDVRYISILDPQVGRL